MTFLSLTQTYTKTKQVIEAWLSNFRSISLLIANLFKFGAEIENTTRVWIWYRKHLISCSIWWNWKWNKSGRFHLDRCFECKMQKQNSDTMMTIDSATKRGLCLVLDFGLGTWKNHERMLICSTRCNQYWSSNLDLKWNLNAIVGTCLFFLQKKNVPMNH